jgi:hypothetical protein
MSPPPSPQSRPLLWCWNETNLTQPPYLHVLQHTFQTPHKWRDNNLQDQRTCLSECITLKNKVSPTPGQHIVRVSTINHTCVSSHEILVYSVYLFLKASMGLYSIRNTGNIRQVLDVCPWCFGEVKGKGVSPLFPLPNLCVKNDN